MADPQLKKDVQAFLVKAEAFGMPVAMLKRVVDVTSFAVEPGKVEGRTTDDGRTILLTETTYADLRAASPTLRTVIADSVGSLYHEATHASLWNKDRDPRIAQIFVRAGLYYAKTRLANGETPSDPAQVADEAAASYVDTRMNAWWDTFVALNRRIERSGSDPATLQAEIAKIRDRFEHAMQDTVVGYTEKKRLFRSAVREPLTAPVPPELAKFLDEEILEGKVRPRFEQNSAFMKVLMNAGINTLPERPAPVPRPLRQPRHASSDALRKVAASLRPRQGPSFLEAPSRPRDIADQLAREARAREQRAREQRERDQRRLDAQLREQRERERRLRDQRTREQALRDQLARDQRLRDQHSRDQRVRDERAREQERQRQQQQQREQRLREQLTRDQRAAGAARREQQIRAQAIRGPAKPLHPAERSQPMRKGPGWMPGPLGGSGGPGGPAGPSQPPGWPRPIPAPPGKKSIGWDRGSKD